MSRMLEEKRATRGTRMADLIGQAAEDDEAFWNNELWAEDGSDEESFVEEEDEVKPDVFDSDFNDTETEEENDSDNEDSKSAKSRNKTEVKKINVYRDPSSSRKTVSKCPNTEVPTKRKRVALPQIDLSVNLNDVRTVRESTKAKTVDTDTADKIRVKLNSLKNKSGTLNRQIKTKHIQSDLLKEALDTEESNNKWLVNQSIVEYERALADKPIKKVSTDESYIRFSSRRGTYNTITFSMADAMPDILKCSNYAASLKPTEPACCVITGLPAKYRDPCTMLPYANTAAFQELRRRYHQQQSTLAARSYSSGNNYTSSNLNNITSIGIRASNFANKR